LIAIITRKGNLVKTKRSWEKYDGYAIPFLLNNLTPVPIVQLRSLFSPPHGGVAQSIFSFCWSDHTLIFDGTRLESRDKFGAPMKNLTKDIQNTSNYKR